MWSFVNMVGLTHVNTTRHIKILIFRVFIAIFCDTTGMIGLHWNCAYGKWSLFLIKVLFHIKPKNHLWHYRSYEFSIPIICFWWGLTAAATGVFFFQNSIINFWNTCWFFLHLNEWRQIHEEILTTNWIKLKCCAQSFSAQMT